MRAVLDFNVPNISLGTSCVTSVIVHLPVLGANLDSHEGEIVLLWWLVHINTEFFSLNLRDTLQRHLKVHDRPHDQRLSLNGSKRRIKHACCACSQSKLRCDGKSPCSRCQSKNHACRYDLSGSSTTKQPSMPQLLETQKQISDPAIDALPEAQEIITSQPLRTATYDEENDSSLDFPTVPLDGNAISGPDLVRAKGIYELVPSLENSPDDTSVSASLAALKQAGVQPENSVLGRTAIDQLSDFYPFCPTAQETAFWDDPQYLTPLYQGPYADFGFLASPEQAQLLQSETSLSEPDLDQSVSDAPVPTFLDARSSPEPQAGQRLRFGDYLQKTFAHRRHLRNPAGNIQTNATGRDSRISSARAEKVHCLPLMGAFSPVLTSESGDHIWEPENLAHVRYLPHQTYDRIVGKFKKFNKTHDQYIQFATGSFPSLAACNAFMQLFFEEFNPLFPLLHQPSFDPAVEHWLLVLAVIAMGCRFSQISAAGECVDLLQELVRRAFYATIEEDYSSTCEPWLAQAGLLNQIGMQFSKDLRLISSAQSMRSLLASICRQVNCFNESGRHEDLSNLQQPYEESWKSWIQGESMRRLAYALWLVDSQYILFFDLPPILPTNLLRVRLPSPESLWHAPTAAAWAAYFKQNSVYQPLSIRQELKHLYRTKTRRHSLGDFAILLLVLGIFRSALELRHSIEEGFDFQSDITHETTQYGSEIEPVPDIFAGNRKALEYLRILCPENEEVHRVSSLKSAVFHHYHTIGIVLGIPLGELFCYGGYRVTSLDISHCRNRLRLWVQQRGREAREVTFRAGRVFGDIRHSNMHGYYEGRAMLVACLSLWIYGEIAGLHPSLSSQTVGNGSEHVATSTIRLDQHLSREVEQSWVEDGARMRPYLAGVGSIMGSDGVCRLIHEGSRVLCASDRWPLCGVMGKALQIFHRHQSGWDL
ncbi:fungal-specific transcription factor domain-containing protein [Xylogone sp. PMI_703]|nr:fungal-specific transcription factor domain-containing protein [Xylogone sp. PMI_703]